jgi:Winged helix DNA-binding domain
MPARSSPERVLTERELNRAVLARQMLLERVRLPIPRVLERMAGLQMQYAPSGYIGLWSRVDGFRRQDLTRELERRRVAQGTLMRSTIHLASASDFVLFSEGVREARRSWLLRVRKDVDARAMEAAARGVRALLAGGPRSRAEIVQHLGVDASTWNAIGLWIDLVRVPPSGTWERRRADVFALADEWLRPTDATPAQGLEHLVRRYLAGFGPATVRDIASWAGVAVPAVTSVTTGLTLRRFRDERGDLLLDLPRAPLPPGDVPAPVRFLPTWDATLLAHARRTQILREEHRALVFDTKTPHSLPTILVDGQVAGTWSERDGRVRIEPFGRISRAARAELLEETERLERFLS